MNKATLRKRLDRLASGFAERVTPLDAVRAHLAVLDGEPGASPERARELSDLARAQTPPAMRRRMQEWMAEHGDE
jgi:hypothetical protein